MNINGVITNIQPGSITLPASTINGTIYVNIAGSVVTGGVFGANVVPLATFTTGTMTITSITDQRVFLGDNVVFGVPITQLPDQTNTIGTTNNFAMADHMHTIPTSAPIITLSATTTNADGSASTFSRSDHTHAITTGVPITQTPDQTNSSGVSANLARADHIHNIPTSAPVTQAPDQSNSDGVATTFSRSDHVHNIPTAIASSVASTNTQGSSTSFTRADHTHQGVHSINANGGTQRYGDISLQQGAGINVSDNGTGILTVSTTNGSSELIITAGSGLTANYTGGRVNTNGVITNIPAGSIVLPASTINGTIYVNTSGVITASASNAFGANVVPLATFTTGVATINSITDQRVFLCDNVIFGVPITQTPDQTNAIGITNNYAMADHIHNIPTSAPIITLSATTTNADGSASTFSRSDHSHAITTGAPITQTPDQANNMGSSSNLARADHIHNIPTLAPITQTPNQTNTDGVATTFSRSDHIHNIPTAAPITTLSATTANAQGSASTFSQSDHTHAIATGVPITQTPDQTNASGVSSNLARADHVHNIPTSAPISQIPNQTNADGVATTFSRSDHIHNIPTAIASSVASTNTQGVSTSFSQADHTHQGVHSVNANGGTQRFGDVTLQQGSGINIINNDSGIFTVSTTSGSSELVVTAGSGLIANYTGGRVNINGIITNVPAGSITLPASTTNGTIYVNIAGNVTSGSTFGANVVPLALFTTGETTITSITDQRVFLCDNVVFGTSITQTPNQTNAIGSTNNYAMADHVHNIPTAAPITTLSATTTNTQGSASSFSQSDHTHAIATGVPITQTPDQTNSSGVSANLSRADHVHNIPTSAPSLKRPIRLMPMELQLRSLDRIIFTTFPLLSQSPLDRRMHRDHRPLFLKRIIFIKVSTR